MLCTIPIATRRLISFGFGALQPLLPLKARRRIVILLCGNDRSFVDCLLSGDAVTTIMTNYAFFVGFNGTLKAYMGKKSSTIMMMFLMMQLFTNIRGADDYCYDALCIRIIASSYDDNCYFAFLASPAVVLIILITHSLHLKQATAG